MTSVLIIALGVVVGIAISKAIEARRLKRRHSRMETRLIVTEAAAKSLIDQSTPATPLAAHTLTPLWKKTLRDNRAVLDELDE